MKRISIIIIIVLTFNSWAKCQTLIINIKNPINIDYKEEIIEIPASNIYKFLNEFNYSNFIILDASYAEIPYQVTYDKKIIFPISIKGNESINYFIKEGIPAFIPYTVYGRQYPERLDDIAWENDKIAYRLYGPALQKNGNKSYGYDILTKSVSKLVIEERYARALNKDTKKIINKLRSEGKNKEATKLANFISYHIDHGDGLDCYDVGPTLGAGTAALMPDSVISYPFCYKNFEILDNGPLRFTVKLEFHPTTIAKDTNVIETRIIQLDKGSHLNKTTITYSGISKEYPLGVGIVIHNSLINKENIKKNERYMSYTDLTTNPKAGNGIIYIGTVFTKAIGIVKIQNFLYPKGKGLGHLLGICSYKPGDNFIYYWGASWSKCNFTEEKWNNYLKNYILKLNQPLLITIKD